MAIHIWLTKDMTRNKKLTSFPFQFTKRLDCQKYLTAAKESK
jgi:hypothetical protein